MDYRFEEILFLRVKLTVLPVLLHVFPPLYFTSGKANWRMVNYITLCQMPKILFMLLINYEEGLEVLYVKSRLMSN